MIESFHLKGVPTAVKNPQANLVERAHQTLNSMIRLHDTENRILDPKELLIDILCACAQAILSVACATLKESLAQVTFGRHMLFHLLLKVNWRELLDNRKRVLSQNNERENRSRKDHAWRAGEEVLINRGIL